MKKYLYILAILVVVFSLLVSAFAQLNNEGTSAATFLKIGVGAQAQGMGSALVTQADDIFALYYNPAVGADIEPVAWWGFDAVESRTVLEPVGDMRDTVHGLYWLEQGASGKSISFDGRTTHIVRKSSDVPDLSGGLTVEAWVAPQVYSWRESAIVDWEKDSNAGFTFGVDCYGRVYFHAAVNGKWQRLVSEQTVPLLHWTHVAATFDKNHGVVIYINGQRSASLDTAGEMTIPRGQDLWLGKSHTKMSPWGTERSLSRKLSFTEGDALGGIDRRGQSL